MGCADVLIDDRLEARDGWEAAGGVFVHYTGDVAACLAALRKLGAVDLVDPARQRQVGGRKAATKKPSRRHGRGRGLQRLRCLRRTLLLAASMTTRCSTAR